MYCVCACTSGGQGDEGVGDGGGVSGLFCVYILLYYYNLSYFCDAITANSGSKNIPTLLLTQSDVYPSAYKIHLCQTN